MRGSSTAAGWCSVRLRIFPNMSRCNDALAALVAGGSTGRAGTPGRNIAWHSLGGDADRLLELCATEGVSALVYRSARQYAGDSDWPQEVVDRLARAAHGQMAAEMIRRDEVRDTLKSLADAGVHPIVLKGTSLAYTIYP